MYLEIYYWRLPPPPFPSFFLQGTKRLRTPLLLYWPALLPPFSTFSSVIFPSVFVVPDLLPIGKESLIEKVSFERVLHNCQY